MKKLNHTLTIIVLFVTFLIPLSLNAETENSDRVFTHLQVLDGLVNTPVTWQVALGNESPPNNYKPGEEIKVRNFTFKTSVKGIENFCGIPVQGTPIRLKLIFYSQGFSEIEALVNGKQVDTFSIDGASGTETELEKEIVITPAAAAGRVQR